MSRPLLVIINGPNLNLVGRREPEIYGHTSLEQYLQGLAAEFTHVRLISMQSNHEGQLIDWVQQYGFEAQGIILNAGGYSHTSIALADAVAAVPAPVIEVHISQVLAREAYRHYSLVGARAKASLCGFGLEGYRLALQYLAGQLQS